MAVDIRIVKDETETRALAKARVEFGNDFIILGGKTIQVKSFNPFNKKKTEYELRIMLIDSMYEARKASVLKAKKAIVDDNNSSSIKMQNLETERLIPQKQVAPISSNEMANRLVAITKLAKDSLRDRAVYSEGDNVLHVNNALSNASSTATLVKPQIANSQIINAESLNYQTLAMQGREVYGNVVPVENNFDNATYDNNISVSMESRIKNMEAIRDRNNEIDRKVEELVESKVKSLIGEYFSKRGDGQSVVKTDVNTEISNSQLSEYENYIKHDNKIVGEAKRENNRESNFDNSLPSNNFKSLDVVLQKNQIVDREDIVIKKERVQAVSQNTKNINSDNSCVIEDYLEYLRDRDFPKDIITEIKEYITTSSDARFYQSEDVCQLAGIKYIEEHLHLNDGIDVLNSKKKIIVLLGPTGVGKTTTLPKIAAGYIKSGKKVSFVTIDNYRIGAVDQLQSYASIMRVPFKSVNSPDSLRTEVRNMDMNSILFVDTTGRSPKAAEDIVALSKYFATVGRFDIDIQLVMSATVKYNDASNILNSFKATNYKGVILTKTDETDYLASSVCAIMKSGCPITYATFGQKVPKDIATGLKYKNKIIEGLYGLSL